MQTGGVALLPEEGVIFEDGRFVSHSGEPWLRIKFEKDPPEEKWLEMVFESAFASEPARALLRAIHSDGESQWIVPAPVLGRAIWRGRTPANAERWLISPVDRKGAFNFRVVSVRVLSLTQRLALCGRLSSIALGLWLALAKSQSQADTHFRRRLMATKFSRYREWRRPRCRTPDWNGFDRSEEAGKHTPHVRFVSLGGGARRSSAPPAARLGVSSTVAASPSDEVAQLVEGLEAQDFLAFVRPGDEWRPETSALVGAYVGVARTDVLYADEEIAGALSEPWFKPAWDPILARSIDVSGRARLFSISAIRARFSGLSAAALSDMQLGADSDLAIRHLPRILLRTSAVERRPFNNVARPAGQPPGVTVIIPTRDRVELLEKCVESLQRENATFEAIIVDNGSQEASTIKYFSHLRMDSRFSVLHKPGPFNFSRLCNEAAAFAKMPSLLLLNNDIEAIEPGWLGELTAWTNDPTVGAVAPKLLYPNGTLQHGGVILGIEGVCGHFEYGIGANDPGYFGRLNVPFSVSAVTGACLAVSRDKFFAVGGLDEENYPIELNDIDFCLRLSERGWRNIVDGGLRLTHHESASRGRTGMVRDNYPEAWSHFRRRWMHLLRNDPAFSPGLSLDSTRPALS